MGVSQVNFNNRTLIDLTQDTVTAETLAEGVTAHGADGEVVVGTMRTGLPVGTVIDYAGETPPDGYLECDGSAISRTDYVDLFAAIGTLWGEGDGETTFNLPDLNGRVTIGESDSDISITGGAQTHELSVSEMPEHSHGVPAHGHANTITATTPKFTHSITQPAFNTPKLTHSITQPAFNTPKLTHTITQPVFKLPNHTHNYVSAPHLYSEINNNKSEIMAEAEWSTNQKSYATTNPNSLPNCTRSTNVGVGDHAATACTRATNVGVGDHAAAACTRATNVGVGDHAASACTMGGSVTNCAAFDTESAGESTAFSLMQPYAVMKKIIRAI